VCKQQSLHPNKRSPAAAAAAAAASDDSELDKPTGVCRLLVCVCGETQSKRNLLKCIFFRLCTDMMVIEGGFGNICTVHHRYGY
jgi:hypothetical protein